MLDIIIKLPKDVRVISLPEGWLDELLARLMDSKHLSLISRIDRYGDVNFGGREVHEMKEAFQEYLRRRRDEFGRSRRAAHISPLEYVSVSSKAEEKLESMSPIYRTTKVAVRELERAIRENGSVRFAGD